LRLTDLSKHTGEIDMAIMLGALYKALLEGQGITEDTARAAAEEVAGYDSRLAAIDTKLAVMQAMLGVIVLLIGGLFWQGFTIMGRLPR
jgi:hypothetical protein